MNGIKITSSISLHQNLTTGNVSNVEITGQGNAAIMCDHQGSISLINIDNLTI